MNFRQIGPISQIYLMATSLRKKPTDANYYIGLIINADITIN